MTPRRKLCLISAAPLALVLFGAQSALADQLTKQVKIETRFIEIDHKMQRDLGVKFKNDWGSNISAQLFPNNRAPGRLDFTGTITSEQVRQILDKMNDAKGWNVISPPTVITPSNGLATVDIDTPISAHGVHFQLKPQIMPDGKTIQMVVSRDPDKLDLGYIASGYAFHFGGYIGKEKPPDLPTIGKTLIVGGVMRERTETKKDLILFITPQIVDALKYEGTENNGPVNTETTGTGETIGHVADLDLENTTDQSLQFIVPPVILESKSGKNQDVICPYFETVDLGPKEKKIVPLEGACIDRGKPAVPIGVTGQLIPNTGDSGNPGLHIPGDKVKTALRTERCIYQAVDDADKHGQFDNFPGYDKKERKRIAQQWCTWANPDLAALTGNQPATEDNMRDAVKKQQREPISSSTQKKIDKGVDTIWNDIELVGTKAKDIDHPQFAQIDTTSGGNEGGQTFAGGGMNVSNDTPTPGPQTQEKKKKIGKKKKKKNWPKPIQDWVDKWHAADDANHKKDWVHGDYTRAKDKFFAKSKHHEELVDKIKTLQGQLNSALNQNSPEQNDKLIKDRDEAKKELDKLEKDLEKDFLQTDDGKKLFKEMTNADDAASKANDAEKEAGKNIDDETKKDVLDEEKKVQGVW